MMEANFDSLMIAGFAMAGGLVMLVLGGEFLVSGATKLALRAGMRPLLIGLTVVAFGTSMPELFVSIIATVSGHSDIMFGNVVGSNIANVGLVLAFSAILYPLRVEYGRLRFELWLFLGASLLLAGAGILGVFPRPLGMLFVAGLLGYTWITYQKERNHKQKNSLSVEVIDCASPALICILLLCGLAFLYFGSDYFIRGAVDIARHIGISELVIGLTLAAVGTSLPELASSISAVRRREDDILVGNIIGSNIFNLLLVLGSTGALVPFMLPETALKRDLPVMMLFSLVIVPIALIWGKLTRLHGSLLLLAYGAYIVIL